MKFSAYFESVTENYVDLTMQTYMHPWGGTVDDTFWGDMVEALSDSSDPDRVALSKYIQAARKVSGTRAIYRIEISERNMRNVEILLDRLLYFGTNDWPGEFRHRVKPYKKWAKAIMDKICQMLKTSLTKEAIALLKVSTPKDADMLYDELEAVGLGYLVRIIFAYKYQFVTCL